MLYKYWIHEQEYGLIVDFMFLGFCFVTHLSMSCVVVRYSNAGSWTRVSRVKAEYPNQLDYNGTYSAIISIKTQ